MKILALYSTQTLSVLRRVQAPFSVLSTRGHSFSFMQIPTFDPGHGAGYEVTVLPNWILSDEENEQLVRATQQSVFAYDLSDPGLLQVASVRQTMRCCKLITVANEYLRREVEIAVRGVRCVVLPSTLDIPFLMVANSYPKTTKVIIGCVGPYDWHLVKDAIAQIREREPSYVFLGDRVAYEVLGDLLPQPLEITPESYPGFLRLCQMGLTPIEKDRGQDLLAEHEYGLLCRPVVSLKGPAMKDTQAWVARLLELAHGPTLRSQLGNKAHEAAKEWSAVRLADQYLKAYRKNLPYLAIAR